MDAPTVLFGFKGRYVCQEDLKEGDLIIIPGTEQGLSQVDVPICLAKSPAIVGTWLNGMAKIELTPKEGAPIHIDADDSLWLCE